MTRRPSAAPSLAGFPPVSGPRCALLILGSFPGVASLERREYYGFARNRFWPLIESLVGVRASLPYARRLRALVARRIALWDVIASCVRPGSRDDRIDRATLVPNDLAGFLRRHPGITTIGCNGGTAHALFRRHAWPTIEAARREGLRVVALPSTSPLNARMDAARLRREWRRRLDLDG